MFCLVFFLLDFVHGKTFVTQIISLHIYSVVCTLLLLLQRKISEIVFKINIILYMNVYIDLVVVAFCSRFALIALSLLMYRVYNVVHAHELK